MRGPVNNWKRYAVDEQYEPRYFARKYKLPVSLAREILREAGSSRRLAIQLALAAARNLKSSDPR